MFEWIDPFIWQLVIVPILTIGAGVYAALKTDKVYVAPLVTFFFNALIEVTMTIVYYEGSSISLSSWNLILPVLSLFVAAGFVGKRRADRQISDRP